MKEIKHYHWLLLITGFIFIVSSFFLVDQTFDIRIFQTFYVIHLRILYWCLACLIFLVYLFYRFELLPLFSERLTSIHIVLIAISSLLIIGFHVYSGQVKIINRSLNLYDVERFRSNNLVLTVLLFLLAFVQFFFLFNLVRGHFARVNKKAA